MATSPEPPQHPDIALLCAMDGMGVVRMALHGHVDMPCPYLSLLLDCELLEKRNWSSIFILHPQGLSYYLMQAWVLLKYLLTWTEVKHHRGPDDYLGIWNKEMGDRILHIGYGNEQRHDRGIGMCVCGGNTAKRWCLIVCWQVRRRRVGTTWLMGELNGKFMSQRKSEYWECPTSSRQTVVSPMSY